ncbi:MAG: translesion error-prone DNA polymerase V autoproteolytic subunit [Synechococcaceae cyanobacterium]|nr:translesion error-prone DNA polymerase V autoproteolytic subunit [Synechococcaceae cyanobacterium]
MPAGRPVPLQVDAAPHACVLAGEAVAAGFPSPADDYVEARIDLNRELIPSPLSTFFMRVCGDAMRGDGIVDGDLLVIDRSLEPRPGRVVVAVHAGRFLVRRLVHRGERLWLQASDGSTAPLLLPAEDQEGGDPELWGVVIHAVHHLSGRPVRAFTASPRGLG